MMDCHVHSFFSGDSDLSAEAACQKAIGLGLAGLAFTEHLDYDFPAYHDMESVDFKIYMEFLDLLKYKLNRKLKILKGIEVGIQPQVIDRTLKLVQSQPFDYVLASVHIIGGQDPYRLKYFDGLDKQKAYSRYLEHILAMIRHFPDFDNVGHMEYIIRCAPYVDRTLCYADHHDLLDQIFRELIRQGKGFEINTTTFRESAQYPVQPMMRPAILRRYRELGGRIITLGSDAHHLSDIGFRFDFFRALLRDAGLRHIAHFENRQPVHEPVVFPSDEVLLVASSNQPEVNP